MGGGQTYLNWEGGDKDCYTEGQVVPWNSSFSILWIYESSAMPALVGVEEMVVRNSVYGVWY